MVKMSQNEKQNEFVWSKWVKVKNKMSRYGQRESKLRTTLCSYGKNESGILTTLHCFVSFQAESLHIFTIEPEEMSEKSPIPSPSGPPCVTKLTGRYLKVRNEKSHC